MKTTQIIGLILIVAGVLGLIYGGFSYTKDTTALKVGPIELKVQEKETISIPMVASGAALAIGAFLMFAGRVK
jgi:TRAP-type C4-dicarboxylate transport system permease small subunit